MAESKTSLFKVHVTPKASNNALVSWDGTTLKVRLNSVPEKGKANKELINFLSGVFGVAKSRYTTKTLEVDLPPSQLSKVIDSQLS